MKQILVIASCALLAWSASASDVYVVTDAKGNRVYTDRPERLPAEKIGIQSAPAPANRSIAAGNAAESTATTGDRAAADPGTATRAKELTAEDLAKRCADARHRYEVAMNSSRLYEQQPDGERRYLTSEEIVAARINAKQTMDTFCGGQ